MILPTLPALRPSPVERLLRRRALARSCVLAWSSMWGNHARLGPRFGGGQKSLTVSSPAKNVYDETLSPPLLRTYPANLLPWGARQEPARTSVARQSQTMGTTWAPSAATVTENTHTAPDGTQTADKLESASDGTSRNANLSWASTAAQYCASIFVKKGTMDQMSIGLYDTSASGFISRMTYTFSTGVAALAAGSGTVGSVVLANGWVRIWLTGTYPAGGTDRLYVYHGGTGATVTGDYGIFWGAQIELGSYPSSYKVTTTGDVSSAADALRLVDANLFGPLAREGSLLLVVRPPFSTAAYAADAYLGGLNGADSADNFVGLYAKASDDKWYGLLNSDGNPEADIEIGQPTPALIYPVCLTWKADSVNAYMLGLRLTEDTSAAVPLSLDRLELGGGISTDARAGVDLLAAAAFDRALQPHEAQELTLDANRWKFAA